MISGLCQSINVSQTSLNKKSPLIHSTSLSSFRLIVQVPLTDFHFSYITATYYNVWLNKHTLSRGLLLLLSFAEHKVISSKSSTHNTVASGIFIKVCMMRKPVKTGKRLKLWPNILSKGIGFNVLLSDFVTNSYGESWDSACEKSWVPVQNQRVPVKKTNLKLKMLGPLCNQTVNLKIDSKTLYYSLLKLKYSLFIFKYNKG